MPKEHVDHAGKAISEGVHAAGKAIQGAGQAAIENTQAAGKAIKDTVGNTVSPEQIQELLDTCYGKAINGIPGASKPIDELVEDYLSHSDGTEAAAKSLIRNQLIKTTTSGALSAAAGFLTLPVTLAAIPANIANVIYVQIRMVAAIAKLGGYDTKSDQVQTLVYACLAGTAASDILKEAGITLGTKLANAAVQKIPFEVIKKINQAVSFRLVTKFGETGLVNLGKLVPFAGVVIGGAFDYTTTKIIADNAYRQFINVNELNVVEATGLVDDVDEAIEEVAKTAENSVEAKIAKLQSEDDE